MAISDLSKHSLLPKIYEAFADSPAEIFVVGGAVRDALLDRPLGDLDLVVRGIPADALEERLRSLGKVNLVGKKFAVYKLILQKHVVDIALPRTDKSFGTGKYTDVTVTADPNLPIESDLQRRDFTINAMAWNVATQQLIDPCNGQADVSAKVIRTVGDPLTRFTEDATRIIRAVRFAVQLGFTIEPTTAKGIIDQKNLLSDETLSHHVLRNELTKIFTADADQAIALCNDLGLTDILLPGFSQLHNEPAKAALVRREGFLSLIKQYYGH